MIRNNLLKTALFLVLGVAAGCGAPNTVDVVQVTFDVTAPQSTPETAGVYIIGDNPNLGNNSNDSGLKLRLQSKGKYKGSVYLPKGTLITYRVRLKDPSAAELNAAGSAAAPHTLSVGSQDASEPLTIAQWDVPSETVHPKVTFVVVVPAGTPGADTLYIAGNQPELGPWNPSFKALAKGGDGKYRVTIQFAASPGTGVEYKFVRGDWAKVEKNADGSELSNRTLSIPGADATVDATVARWADSPAP